MKIYTITEKKLLINSSFLLSKNIADKEHHLLSLAYDSLRKKVGDALVTLRNKYQDHEKNSLNTIVNFINSN